MAEVEIPLRGKWGINKIALVDIEDLHKIKPYLWRVSKNGYVVSFMQDKGRTKHFLMHRHILGLVGSHPFVDHVNDNKLDNRKQNLRLCTNKENISRKRKLPGFTSSYKGVSWEKRVERWRVTIMHNYKQIHVGTFKSELEAANAYDVKALELFGDFARLNHAKCGQFDFKGGNS